MLESVNPFSLPRRGLARLAEFVFLGEILDATGILPGFHHAFFGKWTLGYTALALAGSLVFDLIGVATQPDLLSSSCVEDEPELPLGEEK